MRASVAGMARRVYSTDDGDLRKARPQQKRDHAVAGGRVKVRRETAGRKGKGVTTITGVPVSDEELLSAPARLLAETGRAEPLPGAASLVVAAAADAAVGVTRGVEACVAWLVAPERCDPAVAAWLRHGWFVTVAYIVGFFVMLALWGWYPTDKRGKTAFDDVPAAVAHLVSLFPAEAL